MPSIPPPHPEDHTGGGSETFVILFITISILNEQIEGIDYLESFAHVVRWTTIRTIIAQATSKGLPSST